ncbi:putative ABC transporter ATP-binding protein YbhF [Pseudomonas aeruginosa]|nr:putative ABC transporter ATP-binding protein YbhF [Pseudomonas aeruginosa]
MIETRNLGKRFGSRVAVDDLSFQVETGEVLGFLGPNGAGKSTTMKMLTGFLAPSAGTASIFGFDIRNRTLQAQRLIGYLPEGSPCYAEMTVQGFLDFIAEIRGYRGAGKRERVARALGLLELDEVRRQTIETLSKGFRRRVGLAQAILHEPRALVLDEPTDGLDPNQKHQVRELIRGLAQERIVIISTHILEEVSALCSRALVIGGGRLLADSTPLELASRSRYHQAVTLYSDEPLDAVALAVLPGVAGGEPRRRQPDRPGAAGRGDLPPGQRAGRRARLADPRTGRGARPARRGIPQPDPGDGGMKQLPVIFKRELASYFATPLAYVFIVIFLVLAGVFTFYLGNFYERNQADLASFFAFHPWLYLFLVPALAMRLWAEERKSGSIELLMTLPLTRFEAVAGKFLAAWAFAGIALLLTFPMVLTVNYLGEPDNGAILAGYLGSWLLAGGYLAIGSCMSALAKNQVIAFILAVAACFLFMLSGFPLVLDAFSQWAPQWLLDAVASLSLLTRFDAVSKGVIDLRDLLYFVSLIVAWLAATAVAVELKKAE